MHLKDIFSYSLSKISHEKNTQYYSFNVGVTSTLTSVCMNSVYIMTHMYMSKWGKINQVHFYFRLYFSNKMKLNYVNQLSH
jgi:hypothetical protein